MYHIKIFTYWKNDVLWIKFSFIYQGFGPSCSQTQKSVTGKLTVTLLMYIHFSRHHGVWNSEVYSYGFLQAEPPKLLLHLQNEQHDLCLDLHGQRSDAHLVHVHLTVKSSGIGFLPVCGTKRSFTISSFSHYISKGRLTTPRKGRKVKKWQIGVCCCGASHHERGSGQLVHTMYNLVPQPYYAFHFLRPLRRSATAKSRKQDKSRFCLEIATFVNVLTCWNPEVI